MKALFRIYIGKGRYIAVFPNGIILEYYDDDDKMINAKPLLDY